MSESIDHLLTPELANLVRTYNRPGPRYTSYPTAPEWHDDFSPLVVTRKLEDLKSAATQTPISLYLHIPFCAEICYFCGCNTFMIGDKKFADTYLDHLIHEIDMLAAWLPAPRQTVQMHWGGGTPTFLTEAQISRLFHAVSKHFTFTNDAEIAIELDPRVTSESQTRLLRQLGFNRVSFGVQDNDPEVQRASNRVQPVEVTEKLYKLCRELGFESINFDLIYGLPKQTTEKFAQTIKTVLQWQPDRIALFSYAHVPWLKPFQKKINPSDLPPPDSKFTTFLMARQSFIAAGYEPIGMDHFALPNDELAQARRQLRLRRNFQGYTVKPESHVYALGISAISDLGDLYVQNQKKFNHYYERLDNNQLASFRGYQLDRNDQIRRQIIMQLLCNFCLDIRSIETRYGLDFNETFAGELHNLQPFINDRLLTISGGQINVTELGQLFIRNICMVFDDHLQRHQTATQQMYSKTV